MWNVEEDIAEKILHKCPFYIAHYSKNNQDISLICNNKQNLSLNPADYYL